MSLELERDRGARAQRILEDDLWRDAVDKVRRNILRSWESSEVEDAESRERAWLELRLLKALVGEIEGVLKTGELARRQLEKAKK